MCGLVGIAGNLEFRDEATMRRMFVFDYFRGMDSTGLATLRNNRETRLVKMASHPIDLFDTKKFTEALSGSSSSVFLGHNRAATKGAVNGVNAHPFRYGHILGAHNGTLDTMAWTRLKGLCGEDTDVDSQAVFASMAAVGVEETITNMSGAWALVWIDLKDNTLNFIRNKERPLWYAYTAEFDKILWASEYHMIESATRMAPDAQRYKLHVDTEGYTYHQFPENMWYKYDIDDLRKKGALTKPLVKELKGKEPAKVVTNYYGHTSPFPAPTQGKTGGTVGSNSSGSTAMTTMGTAPHGQTMTPRTSSDDIIGKKFDNVIHIHPGHGLSGKEKASPPETITLRGDMKDPWGGMMTELRFQEAAKHGCQWCGGPVFYHDVGTKFYEADCMVVCNDCTGDANRNHFIAAGPATLTRIACSGTSNTTH